MSVLSAKSGTILGLITGTAIAMTMSGHGWGYAEGVTINLQQTFCLGFAGAAAGYLLGYVSRRL